MSRRTTHDFAQLNKLAAKKPQRTKLGYEMYTQQTQCKQKTIGQFGNHTDRIRVVKPPGQHQIEET